MHNKVTLKYVFVSTSFHVATIQNRCFLHHNFK